MTRGNAAGRLGSLRNMTSFQHFNPETASDLALDLGRFCADLGAGDAADAWFAVAAFVAGGKSPPSQALEARVSKACRAFAKALDDHAGEVDKATEAQARASEAARAKSGKGAASGSGSQTH